MKKFFLIAFTIGLISIQYAKANSVNHYGVVYQEKVYNKIAVEKVPATILKEISEKYAGYEISQAYASEDSEYKLVLKKDDKLVTVYYDAKGEFIKEQK